jgi:hypothetical protein
MLITTGEACRFFKEGSQIKNCYYLRPPEPDDELLPDPPDELPPLDPDDELLPEPLLEPLLEPDDELLEGE